MWTTANLPIHWMEIQLPSIWVLILSSGLVLMVMVDALMEIIMLRTLTNIWKLKYRIRVVLNLSSVLREIWIMNGLIGKPIFSTAMSPLPKRNLLPIYLEIMTSSGSPTTQWYKNYPANLQVIYSTGGMLWEPNTHIERPHSLQIILRRCTISRILPQLSTPSNWGANLTLQVWPPMSSWSTTNSGEMFGTWTTFQASLISTKLSQLFSLLMQWMDTRMSFQHGFRIIE